MEYYFAFHSITIFFLIGFKSYFSFLFLSMLDLSIVDFSQRDLCDKLYIKVTDRSCICELGISILPPSMIFFLEFVVFPFHSNIDF
jgi:hypothetical protein